jgi:hypothetical protein
MTIYFRQQGREITAWIERSGVKVYESTAASLELAIGQLCVALANRDDPAAKPRVRIIEVKP